MKDDGGIKGYNVDAEREEIYYFGIIDVLIKYETRKKMEQFFKALGGVGNEVSVVPPSFYAERFVGFMQSILPPDTNFEEIESAGKVVKKAIREEKDNSTEDIYARKTSLFQSWINEESSDRSSHDREEDS